MNRPSFSRIALLAVVIAICLATTACAAPQAIKLTILHTNDIHGHLFPFDYDGLGSPMTDVGGAARRATLIRDQKANESSPVLVMDAGDVFQRGPLDCLKGAPDFAVMNAVPYDVMTLGNNEFKSSDGPEAIQELLARVSEAHFPVLSANVFDGATGKLFARAYAVFDMGGLKVGVFGLTTPRTASYPQAKGLRIDDPIETAKKMVAELSGKVDIIIALTHLGFPSDLELASAVPGIAVIIGGDSHTRVDQPLLVKRSDGAPDWAIGGTLVCQDGEWGLTVGRLDLNVQRDASKGCFVASYSSKLLLVDSSIAPAADVAAIVDKAAEPYKTVVGRLSSDVTVAQGPSWIAEQIRSAAGSQIGIEPRGGVEQGLHKGDVTALDVRGMLPFVNGVMRGQLTGRQITNFLLANPNAGIAGAAFSNGKLIIGGKNAMDTATYTVAIEDYYATHSSELAGGHFVPLNKTTSQIISQQLRLNSAK